MARAGRRSDRIFGSNHRIPNTSRTLQYILFDLLMCAQNAACDVASRMYLAVWHLLELHHMHHIEFRRQCVEAYLQCLHWAKSQ